MKINKVTLRYSFAVLIAFLLCISPFILAREKEFFFLDEVWTFFLSNYQAISIKTFLNHLCDNSLQSFINDEYYKFLTGICTQGEFFDDISVPNGKELNYFNTYFLQSIDVHPPLYYFIIHTLCAVSHSQNFAMIGFAVNIIFLLITVFIVYKIAEILTSNHWLSFAIVCFYGFSYEFIEVAIFFRMYAMSACWITMVLYLHLKLAKSDWEANRSLLLKISLAELLALYTHYFSSYAIIAVAILSISIMSRKKLNWRNYLKWQLITVFIFLAIWPQCLYHIVKGGSINSAYHIGGLKSLIYGYAYLWKESFFLGQRSLFVLFAVFVLLFVIIIVYKNKSILRKEWLESDKGQHYLIILIPAISYYFCVMIFTNLITQRYIAPIMPVLSIFFVMLLRMMLIEIFKSMKNIEWRDPFLYVFIIPLCIVSTYSKVSNKLGEYEKNKEIVEKYCKGPAIVWDDDNYPLYVDVLKNYPHSKYIHTVSKYSKTFLPDKLMDGSYTLYANKFCDIHSILNFFESQNYSCQELEFSTDLHSVYLITRNTHQ